MTSGPRLPTVSTLLHELDRLPYGARTARVAGLGRAFAGDSRLAALLDELLAGDVYLQSLAVAIARAAGDRERMLRAARSSSLSVRRFAFANADPLPDDAIEALVLEAPAAERRLLVRGAITRRGAALADRLVEPVRNAHGAAEAARLLPACSAATVVRLLPELEYAIGSWGKVTRRHPDAVLAYVVNRLSTAHPSQWDNLWTRYASALSVLAQLRPLDVLTLAERFDQFLHNAVQPDAIRRHIRTIARRAPGRVAALLLRPVHRSLLQIYGVPYGVLKEFRLLTAADVDTAEMLWPPVLLEVLPHALRDAEARRILALREVREDEASRRSYLAFTSIDTAREALTELTRSPDAGERGEGYALLIACTLRCRRGMDETLATLRRLRNEQDPVRLAAWGQLGSAKPGHFADQHAAALGELVEAALEARDSSPMTRWWIENLALALLRTWDARPDGPLFHWAIATLDRLAEAQGSLALPQLVGDLPRGAERVLLQALLPRLQAGADADRHWLALALARALGRRGWQLDPLPALLEAATRSPEHGIAREAIDLWLAPPASRDRRVVALLNHDASTIALPPVLRHVIRRRQDLLDPYLSDGVVKGRFYGSRIAFLLPANGGFGGWLPRQQEAFARLLRRVRQDRRVPMAERARATSAIPRLPALPFASLLDLLETDNVPLLEAALGALAWSDRPDEALPVLLRYLDGDRARVAMYAVPRCAAFIAPDRLAGILDELLQREHLRITVHKEAIRLLGAFRTPRSVELLEREWARDLPRDVRSAAGHAAVRLLDAPVAWRILDAIAASPDEAVARTILEAKPETLAPASRRRYAALVLGLARHPAVGVRSMALGSLAGWAEGIEQQAAAIAAAAVTNLEAGPESYIALQTMIALARHHQAREALLDLARALLVASRDNAHDAGPERDLPARRRLVDLCRKIPEPPAAVDPERAALMRELAEVLDAEPTLLLHTVALRLTAATVEDTVGMEAVLMRTADALHDFPIEIVGLHGLGTWRLRDLARRWEPAALLAAAARLAERGDRAGGLFALSLLEPAAEVGWSGPRRALLRRLRHHPDLAVRAAALDTSTSAW